VTKSPKATSLTIYLKPEFRESKEKAREVAQDLELTMLRDIVTTVGLYYDPKNQGMPADTVVPEDKELLEFYKFFEQRKMNDDANPEAAEAPEPYSYWMLRFEFNREVMFNRNITMDDVAYVLNQKFTNMIHMIYTDFNSEKLVMRIRLVKETLVEDDDYANFKKVQSVILNSIAVRGVPGIKAVSFRKSEDRVELKEGKFEKVPEYALDTDGSNFVEVMNHPAVDPTRLYTTNVHDIIDILGIEAARAILLTEIDSLFASAGVNYRHLGLLADSMTRAGRFMTVDRYGINKNNIGPLAKASFEETEKILLRAALFGEMDPVTGVSSKIMTGQPIRGGTTFSSLLLDEAALMRLQKGLPPVEDMEEEQEELDDDEIAEELASSMDDKCSPVRLRMNAVLPQGDMELEEPDVELNILE
jgi:DNA-directed RNA polymerase II subunit RPB1